MELAVVYCTILEERPLALRIEQQQARGNRLIVWIPRSQVEHISKRKQPMESKIEMKEWLAESEGLDYE